MVDGTTVAFVAHLAGGGFCLAGADSELLPVYWYSPRGTFDPQNPDGRFILEQIGRRRPSQAVSSQKRVGLHVDYQWTGMEGGYVRIVAVNNYGWTTYSQPIKCME